MTTRTATRSLRIAPPAVRQRRAGAARAVAVTVGALLLAALLNAEALVETATNQPPDWRRGAAIAITEPLQATSQALRLDVPRAWLQDALGRGDPSTPPEAPDPTDDPGQREVPVPVPTESPQPTEEEPTPEPTPTAEPAPARRVATPEAPATLLVAGDSLTESFGPALSNLALDTGVVDPDHELRYSSGLTRRDFFDWPAHLAGLLQQRPADIAVFMVGANDAQPIPTDTGWIDFGEDAWVAAYRHRVDEAMTVLEAGADTIYWVGQPIPRSEDFRRRMALVNDVYREVADDHPQVRYVASWELLSSSEGGYSDWLPDADGRPTLVRRTDGIHLTSAGGEWLAAHVLSIIEEDWNLAP